MSEKPQRPDHFEHLLKPLGCLPVIHGCVAQTSLAMLHAQPARFIISLSVFFQTRKKDPRETHFDDDGSGNKHPPKTILSQRESGKCGMKPDFEKALVLQRVLLEPTGLL